MLGTIFAQQLMKIATRHPRLVRQRDGRDCGPAALATLCAHYGHPAKLSTLRRLAATSHEGTSLWSLLQAARTIGLEGDGLEVEYRYLTCLKDPVIAATARHFVVIAKAFKDYILVGDPAVGWHWLAAHEFARQWSGHILELRPTIRFCTVDREESRFRRFQKVVAMPKRGLAIPILGSLMISGLSLLPPFVGQQLLDDASLRHGALDDRLLITVATGIIFGITLFESLRQYYVNKLTCKLQVSIGETILHQLLSLHYKYFIFSNIGDLVNRFHAIDEVATTASSTVTQVIADVTLCILSLGLITYYNGQLGFICFIFGGIFAALCFFAGSETYSRLVTAVNKKARASELINETLRKILLVKSYGLESQRVAKWRHEASDGAASLLRAKHVNSALSVCMFATIQSIPLGVIIYAIYHHLRMSPGTIVSSIAVLCIAISCLYKISLFSIDMQKTFFEVDRLADMFEQFPCDIATAVRRPNIAGKTAKSDCAVELDDITYTYGEREILRNVSLKIPSGAIVGIIGKSGSGKTTTALIMAGLLTPDHGTVRIHGVDVRDYHVDKLGGEIAIVSQEFPLMMGTVLDNITLGDPQPDLDRMVVAARLASAEEFILDDIDGYQRQIGEDGCGLSAGQKQRIAIARALYRGATIIVLDEPTSALDDENETRVIDALVRLKSLATVIIITHRTKTLQHATLLYSLDGGGFRNVDNIATSIDSRNEILPMHHPEYSGS